MHSSRTSPHDHCTDRAADVHPLSGYVVPGKRYYDRLDETPPDVDPSQKEVASR